MTRIALALVLGFLSLACVAAPIPKDSEKLGPPTEKELQASQENLKKLGIAIHTHYDDHNAVPRNIADKDGKALLSWRVQMLPYIDAKLHKEFKLDEPWDSKTNKALLAKIPKAYQPIRVKAPAGETFYRAFDGVDTIFQAGKNVRFANVTDGLSNTVMVVEAAESCPWTKPDDLPYDDKKPLAKLGGMFDGDYHVLFGDGSVRQGFGKAMDAEEFRKLVTCSDGMVQDTDKALGFVKK